MMRTDRWRVRSGCEFSTRALDFYSSLRFADLKRKPSNLLLAGFRKHSGQGIRRRLVHQNAGDCIFLLVLATQSCEGQGAFRACLYRSMVSIGCMLGQGCASPLYGQIPPQTWPVIAAPELETSVIDVLYREQAALCTFVSDLHLHLLVQQHVKFPASFDLADLQPPELYRFLVYLPASKTILWYFMLLNSSYLYLVSTLQATNRVGRRDLRGDGVGHRSDVINHEAAEAVSD